MPLSFLWILPMAITHNVIKKIDFSPVQNLKILSEKIFICVEAQDFILP